MARPAGLVSWFRLICLLCLCGVGVPAFSWSGSRCRLANGLQPEFESQGQQAAARALTEPQGDQKHVFRPMRSHESHQSVYSISLSELQELESEPLCHRIAARLLINNCQLLDGRDEATVLTDSGRVARDFIDSFAASLAICDLERGSFFIPISCSKFREPALAELRAPSKPNLHVSTAEIDSCLEGLVQSDSAWSTWISYRHKALRFCEAARAENEKDRNIHVFQRVTHFMDRLTVQVEAELEARLEALNKMVRDARANMDSVNPQIDKLKSELSHVEQVISRALSLKSQTAFSDSNGLEKAKRLEQLLDSLVVSVLEGNESITRTHELALGSAQERVGDAIETVVATLGKAIAASTGLQQKMATSQSLATEVLRGQEKMEASMQRLSDLAGILVTKQEDHQERLVQVQQQTLQVLSTLESVSASEVTFKNALFCGLGWTRWWPYVLCPVTTLIVGSYGLPPSATRNIILVGLGEVMGFLIFAARKLNSTLFEQSIAAADEGIVAILAAQVNASSPQK